MIDLLHIVQIVSCSRGPHKYFDALVNVYEDIENIYEDVENNNLPIEILNLTPPHYLLPRQFIITPY